ncbi:MAG TPA: FAD-dependent oxidoreductase [Gemmatimonadaceae bacterium]|nr:FAD-dependent oxidoreductase [Gemmatimonadaceae bacterium]
MRTADVVVLGAGLIGLAVAADAAARGASVLLVGEIRFGEASPAGAGMLAPGAEGDELRSESVRRFAVNGRDLYPSFLSTLADETGSSVPFDRNGILELVDDGEPAHRPEGSEWIDARALRELEPGLADFAGAVLHPHDGSVDNVALLIAMRRRAELRRTIELVRASARSVNVLAARPRVILDDGDVLEGGSLVIATGAWAAQLDGLPRAIPVRPVRGQLLMLEGALSRHVIYGGGGYVVPRRYQDAADTFERTIIGATMEETGFDSTTTAEGLAYLTAIARRVAPASASAQPLSHWAGLRPVTPDRLPILGRDPDVPHLLYACGHGRNGILLAPITGEAIGALAVGAQTPHDLAPFAIERFAETL